ncbi:HAMP domain-containing sensor histidine kinase [Thalassobaculum sp. OXR-137]|uniref:sensor histidine kinase n=1 Tax=Thalassobaculum sp. OXR-137 TaxID=3100173 RepID=UPI002AC91ABC|nr:HAMP domain-containing sensor histidine kinase [Thalassobaculum sp. OXR-137]WPZ33468.1 HAMP domain-containing sensor histidine kinase [Thalassobaculum sp. OXR-137]
MKGLAARLAALIGTIGLAGLGFLFFISYQGAQSVSAIDQGQMLAALSHGGSLPSGDRLATVAIEPGGPQVMRGTVPVPVLVRIAEALPEEERWAEADGRRFVWTVLDPADGAPATALVYESPPSSRDPFLRHMMLPLGIAAVIVVWVSVWAGLYLARLIRTAERQSALEASLAEATENRRLRDSFLAHLSHELRTPLNAIIGFSQVLASETFGSLGSGRNVEYAENIHRSGLHLVRLVGHILDHARIELGKDTVVEGEFGLEAAIHEAVSILSAEAERDLVSIRIDIAPHLPRLNADRMKTMQVLLNLISNAVKFSTGGGSVTVSARIGDGGQMEIEVVDTGIGMSERDMQSVQKPFSRVASDPHHTKHGTGLGLSLSTSLMVLHGGTLTLESTLGKGTRALAVFPAWRVHPLHPDA